MSFLFLSRIIFLYYLRKKSSRYVIWLTGNRRNYFGCFLLSLLNYKSKSAGWPEAVGTFSPSIGQGNIEQCCLLGVRCHPCFSHNLDSVQQRGNLSKCSSFWDPHLQQLVTFWGSLRSSMSKLPATSQALHVTRIWKLKHLPSIWQKATLSSQSPRRVQHSSSVLGASDQLSGRWMSIHMHV